MKKSIKLKLLSLLSSCVLLNTSTLCASDDFWLELRSGAFFHTGNRFKEVFGTTAPFFGVELSKGFCNQYRGWVDVDYSYNDKDQDCCTTHFKVLNTSFGLNYVFCLGCNWDFYLGIGPSFSWVKLTNDSCCEKAKYSKCAFGGVVKSGFYYEFCDCYFVDIFADYLYQPVKIDRTIEIGGVKLGIGIGAKF